MLAVVKEPHIEMFLGGQPEKLAEFLDFVRNRYSVEILTPQEEESSDDGEEYVDVTTTDFWKENAVPGKFLAGYRLLHELTQKQLAERSGIPHTTISAYENSKRKITRRAAIRLANALGEDVDKLIACLVKE